MRTKEVWANVKYPRGFSWKYVVSSLGKVKRLRTVSKFKKDGTTRILKEKLLKPVADGTIVVLCNNRKRMPIRVSRLVYTNINRVRLNNLKVYYKDASCKNKNKLSNLTVNYPS